MNIIRHRSNNQEAFASTLCSDSLATLDSGHIVSTSFFSVCLTDQQHRPHCTNSSTKLGCWSMQSFHILLPRFIRKILMWISLRNCPPVLTRSQHGSCPMDCSWIRPRPRSCGVSHHGDSIRFLLMPTDAVCIGSTDVQPVSSVHDLGVYVSCKAHLTNLRIWANVQLICLNALRIWPIDEIGQVHCAFGQIFFKWPNTLTFKMRCTFGQLRCAFGQIWVRNLTKCASFFVNSAHIRRQSMYLVDHSACCSLCFIGL